MVDARRVGSAGVVAASPASNSPPRIPFDSDTKAATYRKLWFLEVDAIALPLNPIHHPDLALQLLAPSHDHHPIVRRNVPVRDSVLDLNERLRGTEMGWDGHREFAAFGGGRLEVREAALERLGEVPRHAGRVLGGWAGTDEGGCGVRGRESRREQVLWSRRRERLRRCLPPTPTAPFTVFITDSMLCSLLRQLVVALLIPARQCSSASVLLAGGPCVRIGRPALDDLVRSERSLFCKGACNAIVLTAGHFAELERSCFADECSLASPTVNPDTILWLS
jgi:hypothetical protein